ncbi:MAG TPA: hypothetical protein VGI58_03370 [Streptosporangiaceae bacterium]
MITLVALGLVAVAGGSVELVKELTRKATRAEAAAAMAKEIASRWERLPAGQIFPATISYTSSAGTHLSARLVGISPQASCNAAVTAGELARLGVTGCKTMLRATYVDASGTLATTVGIGVLSVPASRQKTASDNEPLPAVAALHAVGYTGTISAGFGDAQRAAAGIRLVDAYLLLYTAGATDGERGSAAGAETQFSDLGLGVMTAIERTLTSHPSPCTMKDIKC